MIPSGRQDSDRIKGATLRSRLTTSQVNQRDEISGAPQTQFDLRLGFQAAFLSNRMFILLRLKT